MQTFSVAPLPLVGLLAVSAGATALHGPNHPTVEAPGPVVSTGRQDSGAEGDARTGGDPDRFDSVAELETRLVRDVLPFLERHCNLCHSGSAPEAGLDLAGYETLDAIVADDVLWRHAAERVRRGQMPPEGEARPEEAELEAFTRFVERAARSAYDPARGVDPGRNVLRRLNNTEYENTVEDVLGVEFDARAFFPADNIGHGFDNVADVQMLDGLLLERYLDAAQVVASRAILWEPEGEIPTRLLSVVDLQGGRAREATRALFSNGEVGTFIELPRAGRYTLRVTAHATQAGRGFAEMELRNGAFVLSTVEVTGSSPGEAQVHEAEFSVDDAGETWVGAAFTNDVDPPGRADRNLYVHGFEIVGPLDPPEPTEIQTFLHELAADERKDEDRLEVQIEWLMRRLWRVEPQRSDVKTLVKLAPKKAELDEALQLAVAGLLTSPRFVFRIENDDARDPVIRDLDGYELATRLSYFLWSSAPDDELLELAEAGTLNDPEVLRAQVSRMLDEARAGELARNFGSQWLQTRRLDKHAVDPDQFDTVTPELLRSMERETLLVFQEVLTKNRSVRDLIDADFTYVNADLARHYGLPAVDGSFLRRVSLEDSERRGILMHGSVLTANSEPNRTSPVKRGKWVLETILGAPLPPPPPGADSFGDDDPAAFTSATARERFAAHRANAVCASCHDMLDPIGFGLERYDAVGRRRERDGGGRIDASGVLPGGATFENELEMIERIRDLDRGGAYYDGPSLVRSVVEKLLVYALGRGLDPSDRPTVGAILEQLDPEHPTLRDAIEAIVLSDAFTKRRTRPDDPSEGNDETAGE